MGRVALPPGVGVGAALALVLALDGSGMQRVVQARENRVSCGLFETTLPICL